MTVTTMTALPTPDIHRDRWGRPVIDGRTYTRTSTLAKALDDTRALLDWNARQAVIGLASSPDLIAAVTTTKPDDRNTLNKLVEQAKERAASKKGATLGTAIHTATELLDRGDSLDGLTKELIGDAQAYRAAIDAKGLIPLAAEVFVVCDEVNAAGTFDRLYQGPSRVLIGDVKTSANPDTHKYAALAWGIQLATYAHSKPYLAGVGIVDWADVGLPAPDLDRGIVVHIVQGTGQVKLFSIDLRAGWVAAKLADDILAMRKVKDVAVALP